MNRIHIFIQMKETEEEQRKTFLLSNNFKMSYIFKYDVTVTNEYGH